MSIVRIELEHDDGKIEFAEGKDADAIWSWLAGCQTMNCIHGATYTGPQFKIRKAPSAATPGPRETPETNP